MTLRSHPYQNAVECGCYSKVFFGLRALPSGQTRISPDGKTVQYTVFPHDLKQIGMLRNLAVVFRVVLSFAEFLYYQQILFVFEFRVRLENLSGIASGLVQQKSVLS